MEAPVKDLQKIKTLLEAGRVQMEKQAWDEAEKSFLDALELDELDPRAYTALSELFHLSGEDKLAAEWRERAEQIRKENWKKLVEAEARGHHEMLGEPGRHEIP